MCHNSISLVVFIAITGFLHSESTSISSPDESLIGGRWPVKQYGPGGNNGDYFDDVASVKDETGQSLVTGIHLINISYGDIIDSIQVVYILANGSLYQAPRQGNATDKFTVIHLAPEEHVTLIETLHNGSLINQLTITTVGPDVRKIYGPFGTPALLQASMEGYIIGFFGRSTNILTFLGVYKLDELKKSEVFGPGTGGSPFDDEINFLVPPVLQFSSLTVWHDSYVSGIQAEYLLLGGSKKLGKIYGEKGATISSTISLGGGDIIKHVEVRPDRDRQNAYISMITFTLQRRVGTTEVVGPFGTVGETSYTLDGNILGFHGRDGDYIDRLGFYYISH